MYLGKADVNTYDKGAGREFLVSNGLGSYGFSTVIGANTRREHGLLVVRPNGATQHSVLVSKIEETVYEHKKKYQLSTNRYKDLVYPDGYRYIQEYQGNPFPSMLFVIHSILLKKSIFMPQGETCTVVKYELLAAPDKIKLDLRPLFAHRLNCDITAEYGKDDFSVLKPDGSCVGIQGRGMTSYCCTTTGSWVSKPQWFENIVYEQNDIPDSQQISDNLWSPGLINVEMSEGDAVYIALSDKPCKYTVAQLEAMEKDASARFENVLERANLPALGNAEQDMIFSSYHLIDNREHPISPIYSGYPSVDFKARDTFVALPGLTIATGREKIAAATLRAWMEKCEGNNWVMPGRIGQDGVSIIDGADNGLWFVYAAEKYMTHMNDAGDNDDIWKSIKAIIDHYIDGINELGLTCGKDALLSVNSEDPSRQWMDAIVDGEPVVKRKGCLVELNALWYNALKSADKIAGTYSDTEAQKKYSDMAKMCAESFCKTFWDKETEGLFDWVMPDGSAKGEEIRPNQILAVSLPYSPLTDDMARKVIRLCWNELYTTYGLRTLDPRHDKFKGRAEGRADQQLKARFRGMAWPWLLGQFITAFLKYYPDKKDLGWIFIRPFNSHLRHGCLGSVAEFFDGMMPYRPHGDVLSAMALGEMLRVLYEDLEKE